MAAGSTVRNFAVGILFLGSVAILGGATLLMSSVPFFSQKETIEIRFADVDKLEVGDDVLVRGYRVGQVDSIRYDPETSPDAPVQVQCTIPAALYRELGPDAAFSVRSAGPLGGRVLEVTPGKLPAGERMVYQGEAGGDLFRRLEKLIATNQESITEAIKAIRKIVENINSDRGLIGKLIQDPEIGDAFKEIVRKADAILDSISKGEGTVGLLIKDEDLRNRVRKALENAADVVAGLKKEDGTIGLLLNNAETRDKLKKAVSDLGDVIDELKTGDGLVTRMLRSTELADNVSDSAEKVQEIVDKVNSGSGTLGQLVNNPKAWEELVKILILAREAIEDLREQAPISTFVNALFATF